jgi:hypothetical protein
VELPAWLPTPIVQQLLDRFTGYLREEIDKLVASEKEDHAASRGHIRNPSDSGQSDCLSISSEDSDRFDISQDARIQLDAGRTTSQ